MMSFLEHLLNRLFTRRDIPNCDRETYLRRWYVVRTKRMGIFVHKFERSDKDRCLHDHPWPFIVIPLVRGYWEHSERATHCTYNAVHGLQYHWEVVRRRVLPIIGARFRNAKYKHRVELLTGYDNCGCSEEKPSWSLFIRFTEYRVWGFWEKGGWIPWNKWWQDKCE